MRDRAGSNDGASGTLNGATPVGYAQGEVSGAFNLGGTSFVEVPNASSLQITGNITLEAWINATTVGGRIIDKITAGGTNGYMLDTYGGHLRAIIGSTTLSSTASLPTGVWTHVALTYDGTNLSVYINGQADSSTGLTGAIPSNSLALRIGADSTGASQFNGLIDEAAVYNRALTATELQAAFAAGTSGHCKYPSCIPSHAGLVGWWPADGTLSDRINANQGSSAVFTGSTPVTFGPGENAGAFVLGGTSLVTVPNAVDLSVTGNLTMESWINATALGGRIIDKITAFGADGYLLDTYSGHLRAIIGSTTATSTAALSTGAWTHVAATYDGANMRLYINGALDSTTARTGLVPTSTNALRIGGDSTNGSLFSGSIDEPSVYNVALALADIQAIYNAGTSGRCKQTGCNPVQVGVVSWWTADTDFTDRISGNNGTSQGGTVGIATGIVGNAWSLSGSDYVEVPNATSLSPAGALTIEAWIQPTALGGRIVDKITAFGNDGYLLDTYGGKLRMIVGTANVSSTASLAAGAWTHVAGTYDGANVRLYINGVLDTTSAQTGAIPSNTHTLRVGADSAGTSLYTGLIDEVVLYSSALGSAQIAADYAASTAGHCKQ
jgi:hypothetical protein